jgi:hypothetical protein
LRGEIDQVLDGAQVVFGASAMESAAPELLLDRDVDVNQRHGVETQILVESAAGKDLLRREAQGAESAVVTAARFEPESARGLL